jgi:ATP adenylyltransferase
MSTPSLFTQFYREGRAILENDLAFVLLDGFPVTPGHSLIIPKREVADAFSLSVPESIAIADLVTKRREELLKEDPSISGFNVGANCGASAGQTIFHCHIHLIPRRAGDTPEPRGGVRGVIPEKQAY